MNRRHRGGDSHERGKCDGGPCRRAGHSRVLSGCHEGDCGKIVANGDLKSMEMGLFLGACLEVLKNHPRDANLVVAVGSARYAIARVAARQIYIT